VHITVTIFRLNEVEGGWGLMYWSLNVNKDGEQHGVIHIPTLTSMARYISGHGSFPLDSIIFLTHALTPVVRPTY
jgi:hypothetical protein